MPTFHFHFRTPLGVSPPVSLEFPDATAARADSSRSCTDFLKERWDQLEPGVYEFTAEDDEARIIGRIRVEVDAPG